MLPDIDHDLVPGDMGVAAFGVSHVPSTLAGSEQGVAARRPILLGPPTRFRFRPCVAYMRDGFPRCFLRRPRLPLRRRARSAP